MTKPKILAFGLSHGLHTNNLPYVYIGNPHNVLKPQFGLRLLFIQPVVLTWTLSFGMYTQNIDLNKMFNYIEQGHVFVLYIQYQVIRHMAYN